MTRLKLAYRYLDSPVGTLLIARDEETLHYLSFPSGSTAMEPPEGWVEDQHGFEAVSTQLDAYFGRELKSFDIRISLAGTKFQRSVWSQVQQIPYGQTTTYGAVACCLGKHRASRAVGAANGANPIPIIVPCHRVVGWNNSLTGFGGGLATKAFLLRHEGVLDDEPSIL